MPHSVDDEAIGHVGALHSLVVRPDQWHGQHWWSVPASLHYARLVNGIYIANKSCTSAACQESSVSGWQHLGANMATPGDWSWTDPPEWKPLWITLPEACVSSWELLCCGCKKGCRGCCKCNKAALLCIALCQCGGWRWNLTSDTSLFDSTECTSERIEIWHILV